MPAVTIVEQLWGLHLFSKKNMISRCDLCLNLAEKHLMAGKTLVNKSRSRWCCYNNRLRYYSSSLGKPWLHQDPHRVLWISQKGALMTPRESIQPAAQPARCPVPLRNRHWPGWQTAVITGGLLIFFDNLSQICCWYKPVMLCWSQKSAANSYQQKLALNLCLIPSFFITLLKNHTSVRIFPTTGTSNRLFLSISVWETPTAEVSFHLCEHT